MADGSGQRGLLIVQEGEEKENIAKRLSLNRWVEMWVRGDRS
jgi:hypothetical protein